MTKRRGPKGGVRVKGYSYIRGTKRITVAGYRRRKPKK